MENLIKTLKIQSKNETCKLLHHIDIKIIHSGSLGFFGSIIFFQISYTKVSKKSPGQIFGKVLPYNIEDVITIYNLKEKKIVEEKKQK